MFWEISTNHVLTLVYANSLLATLNTRLILKGRGTDDAHETVPTFLMVGPNTIPPLPQPTSADIFGAAGKVRIIPVLRSATLLETSVLICIHIFSWKALSRPANQTSPTSPIPSRLAFTEKSGSRKTLSVGLHLTAFLHAMNGPDIHGVFWADPPEVSLRLGRLMVSRRHVMTHSRRQRPSFCWNFLQGGIGTVPFVSLSVSILVSDASAPPTHASLVTLPLPSVVPTPSFNTSIRRYLSPTTLGAWSRPPQSF